MWCSLDLFPFRYRGTDLVPVSSTVIPLSVIEVSYGKNGMPSEEYKIAYLKKLRKKVKHEDDFEDPDTLITSEFP